MSPTFFFFPARTTFVLTMLTIFLVFLPFGLWLTVANMAVGSLSSACFL